MLQNRPTDGAISAPSPICKGAPDSQDIVGAPTLLKIKPPVVDKHVRARALALGYVQRLAMKKIALGRRRRVDLFGVGSTTLRNLANMGMLERIDLQEDGQPTYQLTAAGKEVYQALKSLGWLPP